MSSPSKLSVARAVYGVALLLRPAPLLTLAGGRPPDTAALRFAQILGARQLAEAALLGTRPSTAHMRVAAAVDAAHAVTALVLAERRHHRRLAAVNVVTAAALTGVGLLEARGDRSPRRFAS